MEFSQLCMDCLKSSHVTGFISWVICDTLNCIQNQSNPQISKKTLLDHSYYTILNDSCHISTVELTQKLQFTS